MSLILADHLLPSDLGGALAGRILTVSIAGSTYLVGTIDPARAAPTGLVLAELTSRGALLDDRMVGTEDEPLSDLRFGGAGLVSYQRGGETFVYVSGALGGHAFGPGYITVLKLDAEGDATVVESIDWPGVGLGGVPQNTADPQIVTVGRKAFLVQPSANTADMTIFEIGTDGRLTRSDSIYIDSAGSSHAMTTAKVGSKAFVISDDANAKAPLSVFSINSRGEIDEVFNSDLDEPLVHNRIHNDLVSAEVAGKTFVFSSENSAGSIAVHQLRSDGSLTLIGYEERDRETDAWTYFHSLDMFKIGGQTYLAAGGNGKSLVVYAVSSEGALVEVDEKVLSERPGLRLINDLDVAQVDGKTLISVARADTGTFDTYRFSPGNYRIDGSNRSETINGRSRDDYIRAKDGNDRVDGKAGDDLVEGGAGRDTLKGGLGADDLYGGAGNDNLSGEDGNDWLFGGAGNDRIATGAGVNFARGGAGNDVLKAGDGDNRLFGDSGSDKLYGRSGRDVLEDGSERDYLTGGAAADRFVFANDGERDRILDFEDGKDLIDLTAEGERLIFPDISVRRSGDGVLLTYGDESILVEPASGRLAASAIGLDDFILA